jgi:hypothetical protein
MNDDGSAAMSATVPKLTVIPALATSAARAANAVRVSSAGSIFSVTEEAYASSGRRETSPPS